MPTDMDRFRGIVGRPGGEATSCDTGGTTDGLGSPTGPRNCPYEWWWPLATETGPFRLSGGGGGAFGGGRKRRPDIPRRPNFRIGPRLSAEDLRIGAWANVVILKLQRIWKILQKEKERNVLILSANGNIFSTSSRQYLNPRFLSV
jgi:hypothetical protein